MLEPPSFISLPFSKTVQLCNDLDTIEGHPSDDTSEMFPHILPGQPSVKLSDLVRLKTFLEEEFWAHDLESMARFLWVMTTPSSANVNSLHQQRVKGREIIITEDPRLHLVWIHDRIFIKPIPVYLMSRAFWDIFILNENSTLGIRRGAIRKAALGYLRTYVYLIRRQSDFFIAQQESLRLIPQQISWTQFCHFISEVSRIKDDDVSQRYHYGELRLTRLNFYTKLFLRKFYYERVHGQYGDYFAGLYGPMLFIFAIASTILNTMQVEMATEQVLHSVSISLGSIFSRFSRISLVSTGFAGLCFAVLWICMFLDE